MIRVYKAAKWIRPPATEDGEVPLTGDRRRFEKPLVADGSPDEPDEFKVYDRVPLEFPHGDESPQSAAARAKKVEERLAAIDDKVELIDGDK